MGHEVCFISHYGRLPSELSSAKHVLVQNSPHKSQAGVNASILTSQYFLSSLLELKDCSWNPDLIISHSGFGCGLFAKEVFPQSRLISYIEWCHNSKSYNNLRNSYDGSWAVLSNKNSSSQLLSSLTMLSECQAADLCVTPTNFQRETLDNRFSTPLVTLHEGLDNSLFESLPPFSHHKPVILYASRGFEAIRGFPDFISSLPVLDKLINLPVDVHIVGGDQVHYGVKSKSIPSKPGAHRSWAINELSKHTYNNLNIVFHKKLSFDKYLLMISRSMVFVNASLSFIPSWSFLQAILSRRILIAHSGPMAQSVLSTANSDHFFDSFRPESIAKVIAKSLDVGISRSNLSDNTFYSHVKENYSWLYLEQKWNSLLF